MDYVRGLSPPIVIIYNTQQSIQILIGGENCPMPVTVLNLLKKEEKIYTYQQQFQKHRFE